MIETIVGGSALAGLGVAIGHLVAAYQARLARETKAEATAEKKASREDDITAQVATEDREDRRRMESEVRDLRETVTRLSVDVARCEERHSVSEARERELTTKLDFANQLIERQRSRIDEMEARDRARDAEVADLRTRFDAVVKAAMLRDSIPPGVPAE